MSKKYRGRLPGGVWSAAPTPFTAGMDLDEPALGRMLEHDRLLGINGYFIAGTNGEGPWMTDAQRRRLLRFYVRHARGRAPLAVQVTDNSAARMLDNIARARDDGAEIAVIAPPYFIANKTPEHILRIYLETIRQSPLPVGIYDRGANGPVAVSAAMLRRICAGSRVVMVKDSSAVSGAHARAPGHPPPPSGAGAAEWLGIQLRAVSASRTRRTAVGRRRFQRLSGAPDHRRRARHGDLPRAEKLQARMNRLMYDVYGGKKSNAGWPAKNNCWWKWASLKPGATIRSTP